MTYEEIISHFTVTKTYRNKVQCICPAHTDKEASLTISKGKKGTVMHCHANCDTEKILGAVGLQMSDLFDDNSIQDNKERWRAYVEGREKRQIEDVYNYVDLNGDYAFTRLRLSGKKFIYGTFDGDRFNYGLNGKSRKSIPAAFCESLRGLKKAIEDGERVFYCEGEKDVKTVNSRGLVGITCGATGDWVPACAELFRGADVVILQDNDEPGKKSSRTIAKDLRKVAESVTIIVPTPDIDKGDISDFFENHTVEDLETLLTEEPKEAEDDPDPEPSLVDRLRELDVFNEYPLNDLGASRLFSDVFSSRHKYNQTAGDWMFYDGKAWMPDKEGLEARKSAKLLCDALRSYVGSLTDVDEDKIKALLKYCGQWSTSRYRASVINDSRDYGYLTNSQLDADDYLLNVENGTLRLQKDNMEFLPHDPNHLLSKLANVTYDPQAKAPRWERFLDEIMVGNEQKIRYLQKQSGLCLTGNNELERMWFLYGSTTRNGKSCYLETLSYILGNYALSMKPESLAVRNNDSRTASGDIARLCGTRLVVISEIPKRMPLDTSLLKSLTGRDTIVARHLHQSEFEFTPKFKLVCNTNFLPVTNDTTIFKSGRISVISFDRHFEESEQDKSLKSKLKEEASGILNWMIEGLKLYYAEGLNPPDVIRMSTADYAETSDKLGSFIKDTLKKQSDCNIGIKQVYEKYCRWCEDCGYHAESKGNFIAEVKAKGIFSDRGMVGGTQTRNIIVGYKLIAEEDTKDMEDDFVDPPKNTQEEIPFL